MRLGKARLLLAGLLALAAMAAVTNIKGVLEQTENGQPVLETDDGRTLSLTGDAETMGVLKDDRLKGEHFEVRGEGKGDSFEVGPIYKQSMWVWQDGKRYKISYWCEVCSIRSYSPGVCDCCQEETELDLELDSN